MVLALFWGLSELEKAMGGRVGAAAPGVAAPAAAPPGAPPASGPIELRPPPGVAAAPPARIEGDQTPTLGAPPRNLGTIPMTEAGPAAPPPHPQSAAPRPQGAAAPSATPAPAAQAARLPPGTPKEQYEYAFDFLKRTDYAAAEQALRAFVAAHPNDGLAGNAQYWLGETFYARNNFNDAAAQFLLGYQKYPQGAKAPDDLFKLGLSLGDFGRVPEACAALGRFEKEYPTALVTLRRRVNDERQRLGCS